MKTDVLREKRMLKPSGIAYNYLASALLTVVVTFALYSSFNKMDRAYYYTIREISLPVSRIEANPVVRAMDLGTMSNISQNREVGAENLHPGNGAEWMERFREFVTPEVEEGLHLESWMTDDAVWGIPFNDAVIIDTEPHLTLDPWMLDDQLFNPVLKKWEKGEPGGR